MERAQATKQPTAPTRVTQTTAIVRDRVAMAHPIIRLQRHAGNRATGRLVQAKLRVGQPGDVYEQEAERVADEVMRMPDPGKTTDGRPVDTLSIRRKCDECEREEKAQRQPVDMDAREEEEAPADSTSAQASPIVQREHKVPLDERRPLIRHEEEDEDRGRSPSPLLQRQDEEAGPENEEPPLMQRRLAEPQQGQTTSETVHQLHRSAAAGSNTPRVSPQIDSTIQSSRGRGVAIPQRSRGFFESRFGTDFSNVRFHTDTGASTAARSLRAQAFTVGSDIFFGEGHYRPGSARGRQLIAHELTHVIQQGGAGVVGSGIAQKQSAVPDRRIQRNALGDIWEGATELGSRALGGLSRLGSGVLSGLQRLGGGVMEALESMGELALEWGPRILTIVSNPVGALTGGLWLALPDRLKPPLINTLVSWSTQILEALRGAWAVVLGMLWPILREFMLGFLRRMARVPDAMKIALSNRLANLMTGGSVTFLIHFLKGLALGVWDVIRFPYDLIVGLIDGLRVLADFIGRMTREDLAEGINLLSGSMGAAWSGIREMISNPRRAVQFFETIWDAIAGAVRQMGRGLANALITLFQLPDDRLGEESGRIAGSILVDVIIGVFTAGAAALLRRAAAAAQQMLRMFRAGRRALAAAIRLARNVVRPLTEGVQQLIRLFRESRFGQWLSRLGGWLNRMLTALFAAMGGAALHETGAEGETQETEDDEAAEGEDEETLEVEVEIEAVEITPAPPPAVGEEEIAQRQVHRGERGERQVINALRRGRVPGLPAMDHVFSGQYDRGRRRGARGQDIFAFKITSDGKLVLYRIEVKGGRSPRLGRPFYGRPHRIPQTGAQWTREVIDLLIRNNPQQTGRLMALTGARTHAELRSRLIRGRSVVIISRTARRWRVRRLRRAILRIPRLGRRGRPRIIRM
jgi:hypothetical protein